MIERGFYILEVSDEDNNITQFNRPIKDELSIPFFTKNEAEQQLHIHGTHSVTYIIHEYLTTMYGEY